MMTEQTGPQTQEIIDLFGSRANMYGLLASLYREEIDIDRLRELQGMRFPLAVGNDSIDDGYRDMYDYLKLAWEGSITELSVDYSRTFIGSGVNGYSAAYLYESVYTSGRRLLAREARTEVLEAFRENHLVKGKWNDIEDHLALELEFMQILSLRTKNALADGDEDAAIEHIRRQYDFLQNHLLNWLPMLVGDILRFSQTKFYRGLGKLSLGYCEEDKVVLQELVESARETVDVPG
jgi:TorA-specific chaperone